LLEEDKDMIGVRKTVCLAVAGLLLFGGSALGAVTVGFDQSDYYVDYGEVFTVDIVAEFDIEMAAWGLDFNVDDATVAWLDSFTITSPPWDPVVESLDDFLLGGRSFPVCVEQGTHTLATLTMVAGTDFAPAELSTGISLSYDDEDEGFLDCYDGLSDVIFEGATIHVPEPATLALLALGGVALLRRR
jgi:hypothetical protein